MISKSTKKEASLTFHMATMATQPGNLCSSCQTDNEANEVIDLQQLFFNQRWTSIRKCYSTKTAALVLNDVL